MSDPRCQGCNSLLSWTGRRYYCQKCKEFSAAIREELRRTAGVPVTLAECCPRCLRDGIMERESECEKHGKPGAFNDQPKEN